MDTLAILLNMVFYRYNSVWGQYMSVFRICYVQLEAFDMKTDQN